MKKILIFVGLAVLLVGLPLISKMTSGSDAKQVEVEQVNYSVIKSSILASGTLAFKEQVQLRSEVIGKAIQVHVVEGDEVSVGDPLITLDPKSYQAQVDQADARVRMARIAIERQRLLISTLSERFERQKTMYAKKLVDQDSFQQIESELELAKVDQRSLAESLSQAQAALEQSAELLDKTKITSPINGVVIEVDTKVGETVIAGTTNIPGSTMMVIADPSETLTEVQVDEADIAQVRLQQKADVFTAAYPDTPLTGVVQSIATVARAQAGQQSLSFLVKILIDEQDELKIRPGMSVRADIYTESSDKTLAVPVQAVRYDETIDEQSDNNNEQAFVFLLQNGKAVRKDVEVGMSSDSQQEIKSGLQEGQTVIIGPYRVLRHLMDGEEVEIKQDGDDEAEDWKDDEVLN